ESQSIRPDMYLITDSAESVTCRVPVVSATANQGIEQLRKHGIKHIVRAGKHLDSLGQHDLKDLVSALQFGDWKAVGKRTVNWQQGRPYVPIAALTTEIDYPVTLYSIDTYESLSAGQELRLTNQDVFDWLNVNEYLPEEIGTESYYVEDSESDTRNLTVLLAGHDFKFLSEISAKIRLAGHDVIVDQWENHNSHDEDQSLNLLSQADIIFCEWSLGNAKWYSHNKLPGQRLICRFHAQELRTRYLGEANINNIDQFIFVSPAGKQRAQVLFGIPEEKCVVIGNTFDFTKFDVSRTNPNPKVLGL